MRILWVWEKQGRMPTPIDFCKWLYGLIGSWPFLGLTLIICGALGTWFWSYVRTKYLEDHPVHISAGVPPAEKKVEAPPVDAKLAAKTDMSPKSQNPSVEGNDNTIVGDVKRSIRGDGNTIVGPTDNHGNTILNTPMAIGRNATPMPGSVIIGANAGPKQAQNPPPNPDQDK